MRLLKNISYTLFSNILSMFVSSLIVLLIPKFIGVYQYGMWQIFTFYIGYVGVLHLGWADGLFLRRGGQQLDSFNHIEIKTESILYVLFNVLVACVIGVIGLFSSGQFRFIFEAYSFAIVIVNFRTWITMILQATGNFKKFSINLTVQSLIYLTLILLILLLRITSYKSMVVAFLISQLATCISGLYQIKDAIFVEGFDFRTAIREAKLNLISGSKLMIANFTSLLVLGVVRLGIQLNWSVETFGRISLVLTIANLLMVFINAISLVLFPSLRRTTQGTRSVYLGLRNVLMPVLFLLMIAYFPIRILVPIWLPQYASVSKYISILMPMMVYQGKFEILSNTFMKNLRMESSLLFINIVTLIVSGILTLIGAFWLHNLTFVVVAIAMTLAFRSLLAEDILRKKLEIVALRDMLVETFIVIGFMFITWNLSVGVSFIMFTVGITVLFIVKWKGFREGLGILREFAKY